MITSQNFQCCTATPEIVLNIEHNVPRVCSVIGCITKFKYLTEIFEFFRFLINKKNQYVHAYVTHVSPNSLSFK